MRWRGVVVLSLVVAVGMAVTPLWSAPTVTPAQEAWLRASQLGPYAPKAQDWVAIEAAARREGSVSIWSASSRIPDAARTFMARYPGIRAEGFDMGTVTVITKVKEEAKAGVHTGDIFFAGDPATVINELLPRHMVWNFVPSTLENVLPRHFKDPLLVHRLGTRVIIYNSEVYKKPPVDSWWDLTRPEWKGKILMKDIFESGENLSVFVTFVQHADDFARAYRQEFGRDIVLDRDVPNAAYQWLRDFLKNDPVFVGSDGDVSKFVGTKGQKQPPLGIVDYAKYRDVVAGKLFFEPALDAAPVCCIFYQTYLAIIDQAPHPNAAKLMIRWMMGDNKGSGGYTPWFVPGDYPTRTGMLVAPPGSVPMAVLKPKSWTIDPYYTYSMAPKVLEFWLANQRRR